MDLAILLQAKLWPVVSKTTNTQSRTNEIRFTLGEDQSKGANIVNNVHYRNYLLLK